MSIRQRLTLYWAAVLAAIVIAAAGAVCAIFSRQQWAALDAALIEEADTSAGAIARSDDSGAVSIVRRLSRERDLGPGKRVRLIAAGRVLADAGDLGAGLPAISERGAREGVVEGADGVFRYAVMPLLIGGRPAVLEDGVDATAVRDSIARLRAIVLLGTPLVLLVSVAGGYWLAGRSLDPIAALAAELARMDAREIGRRIAIANSRDEIGRLSAAINALLERVESASIVERRFVSDAAHELRTPLTVLRTGLEIALNRERDPEELRGAIQSALREVNALCATAEELLTMAQLSEEAYVRRDAVNLGELAREVLDAIEPLIQSKHLSLKASCEGGLTVAGNRDHLKRLIINLLDNAIKFTPEGGIVALALKQDNQHATLRVRDTGPGIAQTDLPHIFERFFRGAAPAAGGSGLGLNLCREIVRLHKGEITVRNLPDGCEFTVWLPLAGV